MWAVGLVMYLTYSRPSLTNNECLGGGQLESGVLTALALFAKLHCARRLSSTGTRRTTSLRCALR